jgi:hypothetical protein
VGKDSTDSPFFNNRHGALTELFLYVADRFSTTARSSSPPSGKARLSCATALPMPPRFTRDSAAAWI